MIFNDLQLKKFYVDKYNLLGYYKHIWYQFRLLEGGRVNMCEKYDERKELIELYNSLSPTLKKQLLTLARVIDTTRDITMKEKQNAAVK